jgi:hypothetical protein
MVVQRTVGGMQVVLAFRADVVQRQVQGERTALAGRAAQAQFPAEQAGDLAADRETQPGAAVLARRTGVGLLEGFEHDLLFLGNPAYNRNTTPEEKFIW